MDKVFQDRHDAGIRLANKLASYKGTSAYVLALPRGGVVVGYEVAHALKLPFNVIVSRKIGSPQNLEFGIGAVSENGSVVLDQESITALDLTNKEVWVLVNKEKEEVDRRVKLFRDGKTLPIMEGKTVIIVDDGLATGVTAEAAIGAVKRLKPQQIIFAIPVAAAESLIKIQNTVDRAVCILAPLDLHAIGAYYRNFSQTTDEEVVDLLKRNQNKYN